MVYLLKVFKSVYLLPHPIHTVINLLFRRQQTFRKHIIQKRLGKLYAMALAILSPEMNTQKTIIFQL